MPSSRRSLLPIFFLPRIHTPHMKEIVAVKTPEDSFGSSCRRVLASSDAAPRVGAPRERTRSREPLISYTFRKRGVGQHTAAMHNAWPLLLTTAGALLRRCGALGR